MESGPAKRPRGRPRKVQPGAVPETAAQPTPNRGEEEESSQRDAAVQNVLPAPEDGEEVDASETSPARVSVVVPVRRPRGRPRKTPRPPAEEEEEEEGGDVVASVAGEKRKRGRPPKNKSSQTGVGARQGPKTRSQRKDTEPETDSSDDDGEGDSNDVGGRRSGPTTRNSARSQRQDAETEADGSNNVRGRQQTEGSWQPDGREEKILVKELEQAFNKRVSYALQENKRKLRVTKERIQKPTSAFYKCSVRHSESWSDEKEKGLQRKWTKCPERTALDLLHNYGNHFSTLFKASFELFKIDPLSLMSYYSEFRFDNSDNDEIVHQGSTVLNPLWSQTFCDKLVRIMVHPMFRPWRACRLIPLVISWAAMLRLDDRQGFAPDEVHVLDHAGCHNLGPMNENEQWPKMRDRFKSGLETMHGAGLFTTAWAELFLAIDNVVVPAQHPNADDELRVKTLDLVNVIRALDSLSPSAMGVTCEAQFQAWRAGRPRRGYPSGIPQIKEEYEVGWKNVYRLRYVRRNTGHENSGGPKTVVGSNGPITFNDNPESPTESPAPPQTEYDVGDLPPVDQSSLGDGQGEYSIPFSSPRIPHGDVGDEDGVDGERRDEFGAAFGELSSLWNGLESSARRSNNVSDHEEDRNEEVSEGPPSSKKRLGNPRVSPGKRRRMEKTPETPTLPSDVVTNPDDDRGKEPENPESPPSPNNRSISPLASPGKRRRVTDARDSATSNPNLGLMAKNAPPKKDAESGLRGPSTASSSSPGPIDDRKEQIARARHDVLTRILPKEQIDGNFWDYRPNWPEPPKIVDPTKIRLDGPVKGTAGAPEVSTGPADISPSRNQPPRNAPTGPRLMNEPMNSGQTGSGQMGSGQRGSRPGRSRPKRPKRAGGAGRGHHG